MKFTEHLKQVSIALDQVVNTLCGGYADETLSCRAYRHYLKGEHVWVKTLIDCLFFFDPNHCYESYMSEQERLHLPPALRGD